MKKIENYLYEVNYILAGFALEEQGSSSERYLIGRSAKDLARQVNEQVEFRSFVDNQDAGMRRLMPVKKVLYLKQEDYTRLKLSESEVLNDNLYISPGPFSLDQDNPVRNPEWEKISEIKDKSLSLSFEFFMLMNRPLKLHYKKEVTPAGISLTYEVLERAVSAEVKNE
jgi:hypothetical protein